MLVETAAAGLGQALINRWGTSGALGFFDRRRDAKALRGAIAAAAVATDRDVGAVATFGRYDINRAFFDHEGADEIAKLLLSDAGPDARELAHAAGGDRSSDGALVVAFGVFLENLTSAMGAHAPFRERLAQVERMRTANIGDVDEPELAVWAAGSGRVLFVSYSREDAAWVERFVKMLEPERRRLGLEVWFDTAIATRREWRPDIEAAIARADVALLLVSPDFLASRFIVEQELPALVARKVPLACALVRRCRYAVVDDLERVQWAHDPVPRVPQFVGT